MNTFSKCLQIIILAVICSVQPIGAEGQTNATPQTLIDFKQRDKWGNWRIVNDSVMGGISQSGIEYSGNGTAIFQGSVSLERNGGFASVRAQSRAFNLDKTHAGVFLRVKGDGKYYQLRIRTSGRFDGVSYQYRFATQRGKWTTIQVPFQVCEPVFRGRRLRNVPPISPEGVQQIGFMISDKQVGPFQLEIESIKAYK